MTISVKWRNGLTLNKDPDSIERYSFDASNLVGAETITGVTIIDDDVTGTYVSDSAGVIIFSVSGGTLTNTGYVTLRITTATQSFDRTIYFYIVEQ